MATVLRTVKFNGTISYYKGDVFDYNANININDNEIAVTAPDAAQRAHWKRGAKDDDGTVHVLGTLYIKDSQPISGDSDEIEVVIEPMSQKYAQGRAGYAINKAEGADIALTAITVTVDPLTSDAAGG